MFKYSYKIALHPKKSDVVYLSPTKATMFKAFAPAIVIWGFIAVAAFITREDDDNELTEDTISTYPQFN